MTAAARETLPYTPLFCEENIWLLARTLREQGVAADGMWVLLISSPAHQVALLHQRAGDDHNLALWDYHVVLHARIDDEERIYDFDTTLPFPCPAARYLDETFPPEALTPPPLRATIRRIPATAYLHRFHSDRSHMVGSVPADCFPPWPAITPDHPEIVRLREYREMGRELHDGSLLLSPEAYRRLIAAESEAAPSRPLGRSYR
ncbi:protein N-terminal glutamine amidohydrolase [Endothiovibrio diazotrophicus]